MEMLRMIKRTFKDALGNMSIYSMSIIDNHSVWVSSFTVTDKKITKTATDRLPSAGGQIEKNDTDKHSHDAFTFWQQDFRTP